MRRTSLQQTGESENQESNRFDGGREKLRIAAPAHAAPLQNTESNDDGDGDDLYFLRPGEDRKKMPAVFADDDGHSGSRTAGGKPVAPTTMKPANSPMARREKLYWPPLLGTAAPSSAMAGALNKAYRPPTIHTLRK